MQNVSFQAPRTQALPIDSDFPSAWQALLADLEDHTSLEWSLLKAKALHWLSLHRPPMQASLTAHLRDYCPRIAIYPGSFNPFHRGHFNILQKSEAMFDKVIVALGLNPQKQSLQHQQGLEELRAVLPTRQVVSYRGFLTDFLAGFDYELTIIRGLRNGYDLEYELNQLRFIEDMSSEPVRMCFIPCDREYSYLSSTALRSMARFGQNREQHYLPDSPQRENEKTQ